MSTETEHGTITKHNLQKMHAGPYPQKKDVDSIALNAYRPFYTQTLLHTDPFTHRSFYAQTILHTDTFTHRSF